MPHSFGARGASVVLATLAPLVACGGSPAPAPATPPPAPAPSATPIASPAPTPPPSDELAAKIDPIFADLAATADHAPGCVAGVFRAGQVVYAKGFGRASLEHDLPITPTTSFEIGSMSKQLTATAILLLAQDGKLSLGDDVRKYIPELPSYGHVLTLRHLLHHTGGLREYDALLGLSGWDDYDVATQDEALRLVAMQKGTNFAPGTRWSYSNTGYFLLGVVVERVSGKSLAAFSKERIFDPLGMKDTTILDDHTMVVRRRATGYSPRESPRDGVAFKVNASAREMTGEGNVQTTLEDLARWDANFYDPKVGGAAWLESMRTPGKLDDGSPLTYAMGLILGTRYGLPEEDHSGGWAGYLSDMRRFPTAKLTVACVCNRDDVNPNALTDAMAKALLPAPPAPASDARADKTAAKSAPPDLAPMAGAYLDPQSLTVRVFAIKDGALTIGFSLDAAGPTRPMEALDAHTFHGAGAPSRWTFEPAAAKKPARFTRTAPGEPAYTFERFEPAHPGAAELATYAGRYESPEMTSEMVVSVKDGKLRIAPSGKTHETVTLEPLGKGTFAGAGLGIVFEKDARGKGTMVAVFDGFRAVKWGKR